MTALLEICRILLIPPRQKVRILYDRVSNSVFGCLHKSLMLFRVGMKEIEQDVKNICKMILCILRHFIPTEVRRLNIFCYTALGRKWY